MPISLKFNYGFYRIENVLIGQRVKWKRFFLDRF